tara:strand:- start:10 stop:804 length:795 start_codon:yes stop_codon:yes gene_type:complete
MIGLIFGEKKLPLEILKKIKKKKLNYLIIDLTPKKIFQKEKQSYQVSIGQFGKIINILRKKNCKKVLFAGKIKKPNFSNLKLDLKGIYYIPRIIKSSKLGDAAILKVIIKILKEERIKTLDSLVFNKELSLKKGTYSIVKPNINDLNDIKKAVKTLSNLGDYDYSQAVVVRNGKVLSIELNTGTKGMLLKCKRLKQKKSGVLVKFPKKKQDLRIDLPTVGFQTLQQCNKAGIKGIVLKSRKNVFLDKNKCIKFANKNKMFLTVK